VKNLKSLIGFLLMMPIVLGVVFVVIDNPQTVSVQLIGVSFGVQSVGTWVVLSFVVGGVAGLCAASAVVIRLKARLLRLERKLA